MSVKGVKVLVTGADGFIGSHLAENLAEQGADVRALVMYNSFGRSGWLDQTKAELRKKLEIVPADIRDPQAMIEITRDVDILFHLASLVAIPFSYRSVDSYVDTNVRGTSNILHAARRNRVGHVIHTSTSEVYGRACVLPMAEDHPVTAHSPYAATKIAADQMAIAFHRSFGLPVTILRPFNTYGPRQSARAVIPTIVVQLLADQDVLALGNTEPMRDFTYVSDIVDGFVRSAGVMNTVGHVIQLGSGNEISVLALAQKIAELMDAKISIKTDTRRVRPESGEVQRLWCDNAKAQKLLGWKPKIEMDQGLLKVIDWLRHYKNLPGYQSEQYAI